MSSLIIVTGNLGRDPEMRETPSGQKVTNLSVCDNRRFKDSNGDARTEKTWYKVAVWGAQAEPCNTHLKKGRQVYFEGRLIPDKDGNPRIWEGNDGFAHASYEVTARTVQFLGSSNGNGSAPQLQVAPDDVEEVEPDEEQAQLELTDEPAF